MSSKASGAETSEAYFAELASIVAEVERTQAGIAELQAAQARALARAGKLAQVEAEELSPSWAKTSQHDMVLRSIAAEIGGVLRSTDRTVQAHIGEALNLVDDYPTTLEAWEQNDISYGHVKAILETGSVLPPGHRAEFEEEALRRCADDTPGRVKAQLQLLAETLHPRTLAERHVDAREKRGVRVFPVGDGMSEMCATLPAVLADGIQDRLTQLAHGVADARSQAAAEVKAAGTSEAVNEHLKAVASDKRTMDQIRADILADLLLTAAPDADPTRTDDGPGTLGAIRARVQIVVPAMALLGDDTHPADLVGRSPIDPDTARQLAGATRCPWERVLTDPVTGTVVHVDTYTRTAAMDRYLRARDQHCRFPGCRLAAIRCEVDHTVDWALGGKTDLRNLAHLCQRHHSMKQFTAWKVRQLGDGVLEWTSPLGRVYTEYPPSLSVHFSAMVEHDPPGSAPPPVVDPPDEEPLEYPF
jgi:hypothetical protein